MKKVLYVFLISCFILAIISCGNYNELLFSVPSTATDNITTILAFGQSNSANYADPKASIEYEHPNFTFINKMGYGSGTSVWPRLAKSLINHDGRKVVIVAIGLGGTSINFWASDGFEGGVGGYGGLLSSKIKSYNLTHIIFHQGETDAHALMPKAVYKTRFLTMMTWIREITEVPFYLSIAHKCVPDTLNLDIQQAQIESANEIDGVYPGPNTDEYATEEHRFDGCHFNALGLDRFASELFELFVPH